MQKKKKSYYLVIYSLTITTFLMLRMEDSWFPQWWSCAINGNSLEFYRWHFFASMHFTNCFASKRWKVFAVQGNLYQQLWLYATAQNKADRRKRMLYWNKRTSTMQCINSRVDFLMSWTIPGVSTIFPFFFFSLLNSKNWSKCINILQGVHSSCTFTRENVDAAR